MCKGRNIKYYMKKDGRGITLVELLVVIAILSISAGAASIGISLVYSRDAEKCAKSINSSLETARMYALSRTGSYTAGLDMRNNILRIESSVDGVVTEIDLQKRVEIKAVGDGSIAIPEDALVKIQFDKSTGGVKEIRANETILDNRILEIRINGRNASKKAAVILIRSTGKHYVQYG